MYGCKVKKVKKSCKNYTELCRYLDLPTLEEMAIKDARALIRQWSLYEPSDFLWSMSAGAPGVEPIEVHHGVVDPEGTLLSDLYSLSKRVIVDRYPEYHRAKKSDTFKNLTRFEKTHISPDYIKDLRVSNEATHDIWEQMGLDKPIDRECANTFWLMIRDKFNVLERYARLCKTLPVATLSQQEKRTGDTAQAPAKKTRFSISDCSSGTPWRRATHSKDLDICRICGYYINFNNNVILLLWQEGTSKLCNQSEICATSEREYVP